MNMNINIIINVNVNVNKNISINILILRPSRRSEAAWLSQALGLIAFGPFWMLSHGAGNALGHLLPWQKPLRPDSLRAHHVPSFHLYTR